MTLGLGKLSAPMAREIIDRPRLFERIDEGSRPLVWICGPPGAGKTTLAASYLKARGIPFVWYRLGPEDDDPASLFHCLRLAARDGGSRRRQLPPTYEAGPSAGIDVFTRRFFQCLFDLPDTPFAHVFDNHHRLSPASPTHAVLREGLALLPPHGRAIIISRQQPHSCFARPLANRDMTVISGADLRFTEEETEVLVALLHRPDVRPEDARRIAVATRGWAAGIVLMTSALGKHTGSFLPVGTKPNTAVFDYFTDVVIEALDRPQQDALMRAAFLPETTAAAAARLSGNGAVTALLEGFVDYGFFTTRTGDDPPRYEFHPLFRDFLMRRAARSLDAEALCALRLDAGRLLEADGQLDAAADAFAAAAAWDDLARLIATHAPALADQGRMLSVASWCERVPADVQVQMPIVLLWAGIASASADPPRARALLAAALDRARQMGDDAVTWMAWATISQSIHFEMRDLDGLRAWLARFGALIDAGVTFPSPEIEARALDAYLLAAGFWPGRYPRTAAAADRLLAIALDATHGHEVSRWAVTLFKYYQWRGEAARAALVLESLQPADRQGCPLHVRLAWQEAEIFRLWLSGDYPACRATLLATLAEIDGAGAMAMAPVFLFYAASIAFFNRDTDFGREMLAKLGRVARQAGRAHRQHGTDTPDAARSMFHYVSSICALGDGRWTLAREHADRATDAFPVEGSMFAIANHLALANAYLELGRLDVAEEHLAAIDDPALDDVIPLRAAALLNEAELARRSGDDVRLRRTLAHGFGLMRRAEIRSTCFWRPDVVAELCVPALERGIETGFVTDLVRRLRLIPSRPPRHLPDWPWPLKITTLDDFVIERDGVVLKTSGKGQRRPLQLLAALAAAGGRRVSMERLADCVWPEADGDAGRHAFETALWRLRRLLGVDGALLVSGGRLSLSEQHCRLDLWVLNEDLIAAEHLEGTGTMGDTASPAGATAKAAFARAALQARLREAAGCELLPGFDDRWAKMARIELHARLGRALARLA